MAKPTTKTARGQFLFSNPAAQRAEAMLNLKEAVALSARHAPASSTGEPSTPAGAAFRRVTDILAGKCESEGAAARRVFDIFDGRVSK